MAATSASQTKMSGVRFVLGAILAIGFSITAEAVELCDYVIGGCPKEPAPQSSTSGSASTEVETFFPGYGGWSAIAQGERILLTDSFTDGSKLALLIEVHDLGLLGTALMLNAPNWQLPAGQSWEIKMKVDDRLFSGVAVARDSNTIALNGLDMAFLRAFRAGRHAEITVAGRTFRISDLAMR